MPKTERHTPVEITMFARLSEKRAQKAVRSSFEKRGYFIN